MATINDARKDRPVEISAFHNDDGYSEPVDGCVPVKVCAQDFCDYLVENNSVGLVEDTLQELCYRKSDGVVLLTAFPSVADFFTVTGYRFVNQKTLDQWRSLGCNEININFDTTRQN